MSCMCHIIGEKKLIQPAVLENPLLVLLHKCDPLFHNRTFPVAAALKLSRFCVCI